MTHAQLEALIRREIIVEETEDAYTSAAIFEVTKMAAIEMAAGLDMPRAIDEAVAVTLDAGTLVAPANCLRVHSIFIDGYDAEPGELSDIYRYRLGASGPIKFFNFDPRRGGAIQVAPLPPATTVATVEYTRAIAVPVDSNAEVWEGLLPQWHWLVAYRAAVRLMEMAERNDENAYWTQRYNEGVSALAATLGRTDLANLIIEPQQRHDDGSRG